MVLRPPGGQRFFTAPTPGAANGAGIIGFVGDTRFSHKRGLYEVPFDVSISTSEPGATIRFTLDGSEPSLTTSIIRDRGYQAGFLETNVESQSYLFLNDVVDQPAGVPGWPRNTYSLGNGADAQHDYEMDPVIAEPARWGDTLEGLGQPTFTRDVHWQNEVNTILGLMNNRSGEMITKLRDKGYYPSIDPPVLNQRGGEVPSGFLLELANPNPSGTVFYTLDSSDPANGSGLAYPTSISRSLRRSRCGRGCNPVVSGVLWKR